MSPVVVLQWIAVLLILLLPQLVMIQEVMAQEVITREPVTNQRLFDTEPFLPEHYDNRVASFEAQPVEMGRTVFLGDSITEGGDWVSLTGDETVVNRGIGGDITFGVLERLDDVTRRRPSKLFLLIGINDIGKDIPEEVVADNVRQIVEEVRAESPATTVYVQSVLPVNPSVDLFPQHYDKENQVVRLNRLLRGTVAQTDAHFVNIYPLFLDRMGRLDERFTNDGLHLNAAGYEVWVRFLEENGYL
ncbi:MAG: GDSL-type esterase/lipase family protein [Rhodothermales bacterium]